MLSLNNFKEEALPIVDWIEDYFKNLESYPPKSLVKPKDIYHQIPAAPPLESEQMKDIVQDLTQIILPGMTHWQHPNFHAYFTANSSVESVLAEFVTAAMSAQCMIWETSPAAAELEERMMEWLRDMIGLPSHFEGVIQDSASSASLVAILTAREIATNFQSNEIGVPNNLRVYCSKETHSSIEKAVGISGIGRRNVVKIEVDEQGSIISKSLEQQIQADIKNGYQPCCVVAAMGTTGTVAMDNIEGLARICKKYKVWLHIDAAYAGTALILPEYRWMAAGAEHADSFVFNPHKWMFTNFDCSAYFVKDVDALIKTFEILPEYLKTSTRGQVNDYRDWGVPLGRRFRALKLWFVLRSYGVNGIQEKLRKHIELNTFFAEEIEKMPDFELMQAPFLNFTCFRYKPAHLTTMEELNAANEKLLKDINQDGKLFLSHTKMEGRYAIRMVIGQTYVEKRHIAKALEEIRKMV